MRILYVATDQIVPGTLGGSVHVQAVAEGLAALGHDVHVVARRGAGRLSERVVWHGMGAPGGHPHLRLLRAGAIRRLTHRVKPDVVIERYHNFGGEGVMAGRAAGARVVLEVNAPIIDHPGSGKVWMDRLLVVQPMRRWRAWQVARADLMVTPSAAIIPAGVEANRILELEWGADTTRFRPDAPGTPAWTREPGTIVAVFVGAFRAWHGAIHLVEAIKHLQARGRSEFRAVLIGDGPERAAAERAADDSPAIVFAGTLSHDAMPAALAAADIGVAPFDVSRHSPLSLGFYWSPLKIFEYMASGLPIVAPALPRLRALVADGSEGVLYEPPTPHALADALTALHDAGRRRALGIAARERAVREYSWQAHCRALDAAMRRLLS
jgi:glycosyltransferase involved in cell wall biosynthesis